MAKKRSGAQNRKQRKLDAKEARRRRHGWNESAWREKYSALGDPPSDPERAHIWIGQVGLLAMAEAADDPGPPAEQRREQIGRLAAQLVKVLEPAKLSAKLAEYEKALEELSAHGSPLDSRENSESRPPTSL